MNRFFKNKNQKAEFVVEPDEKNKKDGQVGKISVIMLVLALAVLVSFNGYYSLNENEYAVITTFGKTSSVTESGPHFKIPFVQQVRKVSKEIKGMSIGYNLETGESIERESLMITKDYNFVNVDFYIEYRVVDPIKYLYNANQPLSILKNLAQSYIRDTVGSYTVDDVITTGKAEIQSVVKEKLTARIESEDIGIMIMNVTIQDAEPPTVAVSEAFKSVETAKQGADTAINNANKYASEKLPAAEAEADSILKSAEAQKQARINEATGQVARFNEMYEEYMKYPTVTKERMFYEAMEEILPNMKIIIDNGNGILKTMTLDDLMGGKKE